MSKNNNLTNLLIEANNGKREALYDLLPLVHDELLRLASNRMKVGRGNHTLQPNALVHEVYLRLIDQHSVDWQNRLHFFSLAAEMMRRIYPESPLPHQLKQQLLPHLVFPFFF